MATVRVEGVDFQMSERSLELVCEGAQLKTCRGCGGAIKLRVVGTFDGEVLRSRECSSCGRWYNRAAS